MGDYWQPGDLALCLKIGPWRSRISGEVRENEPVRAGMICTVRGVGVNQLSETVLWLNEDRRGDGWRYAYGARRFRKIKPDEADEFDRETIALLTGKSAQVPA